jgi:hypothetical protein
MEWRSTWMEILHNIAFNLNSYWIWFDLSWIEVKPIQFNDRIKIQLNSIQIQLKNMGCILVEGIKNLIVKNTLKKAHIWEDTFSCPLEWLS